MTLLRAILFESLCDPSSKFALIKHTDSAEEGVMGTVYLS